MQLLEALQIVDGGNAVRYGVRLAQTKANLQYLEDICERAFSLPSCNALFNALLEPRFSDFTCQQTIDFFLELLNFVLCSVLAMTK